MGNGTSYDVFLSYNSLDRPHVLRVADELKARKLSCFLDQWHLQPGRSWVEALEKALRASRSMAVFIGPHELGDWQRKEQAWALDRHAEEKDRFPVIPVLLPDCEPPLGFLKQLMWVDLRDGAPVAEQIDALAAAIRGEEPATIGDINPLTTVCPYRGLEPFREEDAAFFFGRDNYIEALVSKVRQHKLVAVVGSSGSGKSSVVRAGLVPKLRSKHAESTWEIVTMVPTDEPLYRLVLALAPMLWPEVTDDVELRTRSRRDAQSLRQRNLSLLDLAEVVLKKHSGSQRLLLVVDQWEELYTQCKNLQEQQHFVQQLLEATVREDSPLNVVLTVRSDFYRELLDNRPLLDQLQDSKVDLGPMSQEELRAAVEQPAVGVGLKFQDGLVDRLLDDAREEPGRLPLLEFALTELWKLRDNGLLTHAAYQKIGRLSGAIAKRAEDIYCQMDAAQQKVFPHLFRRLVRAGSKTEEDTRRRADLHSLDETTQLVVRKLAHRDARLLVTSRLSTSLPGDPESGDSEPTETVEVAHEELLRRWSRLTGWIDEDRKFLQWRSRLGTRLEQYQHDGTLLMAGALREARQFFPSRQDELEDAEREFTSASVRADRERKIRVALALVAGLLATLVSVFVLAGFLQRQKNRGAVEVALDSLETVFASEVLPTIERLDLAPDYASELAETRFQETNNQRTKLRLACALVVVSRPTDIPHDAVNFLLSQIEHARAEESAYVVEALSRVEDQKSLLDELLKRAKDLESTDPAARHRFLVTALCLGKVQPVVDILELKPNPQSRTDFIHSFSDWPGDLQRVAERLTSATNDEFQSGLCIAIGTVPLNSRSNEEREALEKAVEALFTSSKSGGTHGAADWVLRQWQLDSPEIAKCETAAEISKATAELDWYGNSVDMTMLKIQGVSFRRELSSDDSTGASEPVFQDVTISEFWLCDREVTIGQFRAIRPKANDAPEEPEGQDSPNQQLPMTDVTWFDAVNFCNKLSVREGLPEYYQLTYDSANIVDGSIQEAEVSISNRVGNGYRLPTEAEWEYACRATSQTDFCFGDEDDISRPMRLFDYAVFGTSATAVCGSKMPNAWGVFDMHGNAWEWCHDWFGDKYYEESPEVNPPGAESGSERVGRGGSWSSRTMYCRSARRGAFDPRYRGYDLGFRLARSYVEPNQVSGARSEGGAAEPAVAGGEGRESRRDAAERTERVQTSDE